MAGPFSENRLKLMFTATIELSKMNQNYGLIHFANVLGESPLLE